MSDDWDEEGDDAWGEFEEENPAMAVAVDPVVTTIDPKAISQQRLEWLKQVAKALQTFYKDTVTAGTLLFLASYRFPPCLSAVSSFPDFIGWFYCLSINLSRYSW